MLSRRKFYCLTENFKFVSSSRVIVYIHKYRVIDIHSIDYIVAWCFRKVEREERGAAEVCGQAARSLGERQLKYHVPGLSTWRSGQCHWIRRLKRQSKFSVISQGTAPTNNTRTNASVISPFKSVIEEISEMLSLSSRSLTKSHFEILHS